MARNKNVGRLALSAAALLWSSSLFAAAPNVLFVVGANPLDPLSGDPQVLARLQNTALFPAGVNVTIGLADGSAISTAGQDFVIISSTVNSGSAVTSLGGATALRALNIPVMCWEDGDYDELEIRGVSGGPSGAGSNGYLAPDGITFTPASLGNPLSNGYSGLTPVYSDTGNNAHMGYGQGVYGAGVQQIGTVVVNGNDPGQAGTTVSVITYYPTGAALASGFLAPAPRLGIWFGNDSFITSGNEIPVEDNAPGRLLFDQAVNFMIPAEWNATGGSTWNTTGNWTKWAGTTTTGPSGPATNVLLGSKATGAAVVTLDGAQTAGTITFNNANSYTVAPGTGGSLALGNADYAGFIVVNSGSHTISAPLSLPNNSFITVKPATSLTISGAITAGAGKTLDVLGGGTLNLDATQHLEGLTVAAGTGVVVTTTNSLSKALAVKALTLNGTINLKNNNMIVGDDATPGVLADVRALITAGSITTDSTVAGKQAALGYAAGNDANIGGLGGSLEGVAFQPGAVIVKYTYVGDSNLDGSVDGSDVALWAQNFSGALGLNPPNPRLWTQGDWNNDGSVDGSDVALWAQNFTGALGGGGLGGVAAAVPGVAAVPEPASFGLMAVAGLLALRRRRN